MATCDGKVARLDNGVLRCRAGVGSAVLGLRGVDEAAGIAVGFVWLLVTGLLDDGKTVGTLRGDLRMASGVVVFGSGSRRPAHARDDEGTTTAIIGVTRVAGAVSGFCEMRVLASRGSVAIPAGTEMFQRKHF